MNEAGGAKLPARDGNTTWLIQKALQPMHLFTELALRGYGKSTQAQEKASRTLMPTPDSSGSPVHFQLPWLRGPPRSYRRPPLRARPPQPPVQPLQFSPPPPRARQRRQPPPQPWLLAQPENHKKLIFSLHKNFKPC